MNILLSTELVWSPILIAVLIHGTYPSLVFSLGPAQGSIVSSK